MLRIVITGAPASGKTTVAQLVEDALSKHGFTVTNTDQDRIDEQSPRPTEYVERCAEAVSHREDVLIITNQARKL